LCVHVASVIFYFGWVIHHPEGVRFPAEYLNDIFPDFSQSEPANQPKYVKGARYRHISSSSSDNSENSSQSDLNGSFDASDTDTFQSDSSNNNDNEDLINDLQRHVPKWGASFTSGNPPRQIKMTNTCSIDYMLLSFWFSFRINNQFINDIPRLEHSVTLRSIIRLIDRYEWDEARRVFAVQIARFQLPRSGDLSMFGSIDRMILRFFIFYQRHCRKQLCSSDCALNEKLIANYSNNNLFDNIFWRSRSQKAEKDTGNEFCRLCLSKIICIFEFINDVNFIFIENNNSELNFRKIPQNISFGERNFNSFAPNYIKLIISLEFF
jgi:hypothetical protein